VTAVIMESERSSGTTSRGESAPDPPRLAPDQVHLWMVSLDPTAAESARLRAVTSDAERERAALFHRREDAERYVVAHGALRWILARYLACEPAALRFGARENGKPFLEDGSLEFNLSHSGALALIAVARGRRVGVDIELIRPMPEVDAVARRTCTAEELATLMALSRGDRERAFFALWTRKEALSKATGEGIGGVFRDASEPAPEAHGEWTVTEVDVLAGYVASVAAEGTRWRLVRCEWHDRQGDLA
jgi:4'-phosphopantetheinyl transferase